MKLGVTQESGRSEIRNNSGLGPLEGELILSGGTKNLNEIEIEISAEEVFRIIKDDLVRVKGEIAKAGNITLEQYLNLRRLKLSEQPIIDNSFFNQALMWISAEEEERFSWVETDKIVGRPFAKSFSDDGWSHEYHSRTGRIVQIATNLLQVLQDPDDMVESAIDHVFHHQNKPYERIQLLVLEGPGGPIYLVEDGTHRVAAAKLLGLKRIPCSVRRIKYPLKQTTTDREMFEYWQRAINLGLIQGSSNIVDRNGSTTKYEIQVTSELFPWIRVYHQHKFLRINQIYEKVYPDSLRNLPIPRDALLDEVANNHFMAGPEKWQEWVQKFSNKPRDKDGLVVYY